MTGLFGGTFNPPHMGHLLLAEKSREELGLDKVIFIPSGIPVRKKSDILDPQTRYRLTILATESNPAFQVSDFETKKQSTCYTIETLEHFNKILHGEMIFLMGMDSLMDLDTWKNYKNILANFKIGVWKRPGFEKIGEMADYKFPNTIYH